jgi:hypothetical protein
LYECPTINVEFSFQDKKFITPSKRVRLAEAATKDFIVQNTMIAVPRVLDVVSVDGIVQIVQEFIDAPVLEVIERKLPRSKAELHASAVEKDFINCVGINCVLPSAHAECVQEIDRYPTYPPTLVPPLQWYRHPGANHQRRPRRHVLTNTIFMKFLS